jgi:phage-related minor tail protein
MSLVDPINIPIAADTRAIKRDFADIDKLAKSFGRSLSSAFADAAIRGRDLEDVLRSLALRLSNLVLSAALKPVEQGIAGALEGIIKGVLGGGVGGGAGGAGGVGRTTHYAAGGIVSQPTYFPLGANMLGLMGERGAEAILPLARGSDGKLGVRAQALARPASIVVNISTPDAPSFRRSEAYLSAAIARAVARGERSL